MAEGGRRGRGEGSGGRREGQGVGLKRGVGRKGGGGGRRGAGRLRYYHGKVKHITAVLLEKAKCDRSRHAARLDISGQLGVTNINQRNNIPRPQRNPFRACLENNYFFNRAAIS